MMPCLGSSNGTVFELEHLWPSADDYEIDDNEVWILTGFVGFTW